jgi:hypothetical protein
MQAGAPDCDRHREIGVREDMGVGRPVPAACCPTRAVIRFPGCQLIRIITNFFIGNIGLLYLEKTFGQFQSLFHPRFHLLKVSFLHCCILNSY